MDWKEVLGFLGGALTTFSLVPQIWRIYSLKSAREISLPFTLMLAFGITSWMFYGIVYDLTQLIIWNGVGLCLACTMLYAKYRYGR